MDNVTLHDTAYGLLDKIEELRDQGMPVSVENMRNLGIQPEISDKFIDCVIRFESELQTINREVKSAH